MLKIYYFMPCPSKENIFLQLILENSPLKGWHFGELVREAKLTRAVTNKWLRKYVQLGLLKRIKEKGRFPYVTAGEKNPVYYAQKRIFALDKIHQSGLIFELLNLQKAKTIILFGSMIKGDWYKGSDLDIFIYGDLGDFKKYPYELKLNHQIELHRFKDKNELKKVKTGLINNIVNGYLVKGRIQDIAEVG